jgi:D-serine deaminase-like pyridoxal phosphate-dependent protein
MKPVWPKEVQDSIDKTRRMGEELKAESQLLKVKIMSNTTVSELCYQTSDKIIDILDELGYSVERKPAYPTLLRDLIAIEVRRSINSAGVLFYNNVAVEPISPPEQTDDEIKKSFNGNPNTNTES